MNWKTIRCRGFAERWSRNDSPGTGGKLQIQDMSHASMIALLQTVHVGRIACVKDSQPYITPLSFAYHGNCIYSFATLGKRISWMRANPLVCVEVESIVSRHRWQTVIASGKYEELPNTSGYIEQQVLAYDLLSKAASWWEPGFVKTLHEGVVRPLEAVYFCINITELTGHEATDEVSAAT
jgi:nitroimidazol reductase NimA-like FMN-containing flavoprotein (pyridoxamine 5'-phosphate oxidase superfamily)